MNRQLDAAPHEVPERPIGFIEGVGGQQLGVLQTPGGSGEREGGGDVVDGRVPDGVDGHLIALPAGPGHEVGELGPIDIDHAAGVLQAQLGRVGLAHMRATRAHRPVGDHLERPLNQHRGAIGQVR